MARDLTSGMSTGFSAEKLNPICLIKAEFDSGDLNLWSGYGDLVWNDDTYIGTGELLKISETRQTINVEAVGLNFELSGMPGELISIALNEDYQGRPVTLYIALLDEDGQVISDPFPEFEGELDVMKITDDRESCTISVSAENVLISLSRPINRYYTPEDQAREFPNDTFLNRITSLQEKDIVWG